MNLLRRAYLEAAPELRPYFVTGSTVDDAGVMATLGARPGPGGLVHEFVTTPGMIAVVDGVLGGALIGMLGLTAGLALPVGVGLAVLGGIATVALLLLYQYRVAVRARSTPAVRAPGLPADAGAGPREDQPRARSPRSP